MTKEELAELDNYCKEYEMFEPNARITYLLRQVINTVQTLEKDLSSLKNDHYKYLYLHYQE